MSKTYTIHGVEFPVWSDDGYPDLFPSAECLFNSLKSDARSCNGFANDTATVFTFDRGWGGPTDAENFLKRIEKWGKGVWVSNVKVENKGRCAWGGDRIVVTLTPEVKFCFDAVFGK